MSNHGPDLNPLHAIRSYVRRAGRLTLGQQRALDELLPRYGIAPGTGLLDLDELFGRHAPRMLEIGFGTGDALLEIATAESAIDFLGAEVHRPGIGRLLLGVEARGLDNVRVAPDDAVLLLRDRLPPSSLDRVMLFFPDPWHKRRHHKRRIVQPDFVALVASRLRPGGIFHAATDWEAYAAHMLEVLEASPELINTAGPGSYAERPAYRPETRFERRGLRRGHGVWDLLFARRTAIAG